jgi:hypothetical protein
MRVTLAKPYHFMVSPAAKSDNGQHHLRPCGVALAWP